MIIQIKGNVNYAITLDPSVWIFDERKILFEDLFDPDKQKQRELERGKKSDIKLANAKKPPVNPNIKRKDGEEILANSYAMPIVEFLAHAEINNDATHAIIQTTVDHVKITREQLENCFLLFSFNGKPLKDNGPVHLYLKDGSNKSKPIKGVKQIILQ